MYKCDRNIFLISDNTKHQCKQDVGQVQSSEVCDGIKHCLNGTDEMGCSGKYIKSNIY